MIRHDHTKKTLDNYRIDLYIGPASVDWTSLTASKEAGLEDAMSGIKV